VRITSLALMETATHKAVGRATATGSLGFGFLFLAGLLTVYLTYEAGEADLWVAHTLKAEGVATELLTAIQHAELGQIRFILAGQPDYLAQIKEADGTISAKIAGLRTLTADNAEQQKRLDELQPVIETKLNRIRESIALAQGGKRDQAAAFMSGYGVKLEDDIRAILHAFQEHESSLLASRQLRSTTLRTRLLAAVLLSLATALGLAAFLTWRVQGVLNRLRGRTAELEAEIKLREEAQGRLRQAQKLEAVGQLTGGIAHDFNNLLTIIIGNIETLQRRLAKLPLEKFGLAVTASKPIDAALRASQSAAQLTHRLLAFSRQQPLDPRQLDLNHVVGGISDLLRRTLGETISMEAILAAGLWPTFADANQVENALINLCLNAHDAMPEGGKLTIETANAHLDEAYAKQFEDVKPGQYALVCVADTGMGIAPNDIQHVFEPFFTTKKGAQGSGLGLAMVYGFVKQSGGHIRIYSELGHGTTVRIYLPRLLQAQQAEAAPAALPHDTSTAPRASAGETVLLVEDNSEVREYAKSLLEELGYGVVEAADADQALKALQGSPRIDMLFTDVVLPGASGRELSGKALELQSGLPVLFTTGYTRNAIVHQGRLDPGVHLLNKPYTQRDLARKIREVLDSRVSRPEAVS
jgi:signal transduction histidine kinase/ActR/RegA family two-component response regulator